MSDEIHQLRAKLAAKTVREETIINAIKRTRDRRLEASRANRIDELRRYDRVTASVLTELLEEIKAHDQNHK